MKCGFYKCPNDATCAVEYVRDRPGYGLLTPCCKICLVTITYKIYLVTIIDDYVDDYIVHSIEELKLNNLLL